jgi:hypothetical protein
MLWQLFYHSWPFICSRLTVSIACNSHGVMTWSVVHNVSSPIVHGVFYGGSQFPPRTTACTVVAEFTSYCPNLRLPPQSCTRDWTSLIQGQFQLRVGTGYGSWSTAPGLIALLFSLIYNLQIFTVTSMLRKLLHSSVIGLLLILLPDLFPN